MKISKEELKKTAERFHETLEREKIESVGDLEKNLGKTFVVAGSEENIFIEMRPSNHGTMAYTVSYNHPLTGIPMELKINPSQEYSQVIIKSGEEIEDYFPFTEDVFGNITQNRIFYSPEFSLCLDELKRLQTL